MCIWAAEIELIRILKGKFKERGKRERGRVQARVSESMKLRREVRGGNTEENTIKPGGGEQTGQVQKMTVGPANDPRVLSYVSYFCTQKPCHFVQGSMNTNHIIVCHDIYIYMGKGWLKRKLCNFSTKVVTFLLKHQCHQTQPKAARLGQARFQIALSSALDEKYQG